MFSFGPAPARPHSERPRRRSFIDEQRGLGARPRGPEESHRSRASLQSFLFRRRLFSLLLFAAVPPSLSLPLQALRDVLPAPLARDAEIDWNEAKEEDAKKAQGFWSSGRQRLEELSPLSASSRVAPPIRIATNATRIFPHLSLP